MRIPGVLVVCTVLATAGCGGDDVAGYGHLDAGDLATPPVTGHFTAAPGTVTADLVARANGCVNVIIDGVERHPIWPDGTEVSQRPGGRYEVDLPGGRTLTSGETFIATAVIDNGGAIASEKISGFLAFCEVPAAPVLFADATSIERTESGPRYLHRPDRGCGCDRQCCPGGHDGGGLRCAVRVRWPSGELDDRWVTVRRRPH
ncbi:hypothetical protein AB0G04_07450 [Actinoplanes sp. NPDC023801]|uniref:hypothetical protein n=1 Tax=Actinoplanes sp. NPDC023801 TaxID=3154595 RepID=UPI0033EB08AE